MFAAIQRKEEKAILRKPNQTGLPDRLKSGIENLSGYSMDDVRVYYNSSKPAQMKALAYTQGSHIHVAPGQEQHLPHEAWHIVQQKQRRVQPTMQLKGVGVNDDAALEHEADVMGSKAAQLDTDEKDKDLKDIKVKDGTVQTKLPRLTHIVWKDIYSQLDRNQVLYDSRTIQDAIDLVNYLDDIDAQTIDMSKQTGKVSDTDFRYMYTLEKDKGLRRLALDLKFTKFKMKLMLDQIKTGSASASTNANEVFFQNRVNDLTEAERLIIGEIKRIEQLMYNPQSGMFGNPDYVNEVTSGDFDRMKGEAKQLITNLLNNFDKNKMNIYFKADPNNVIPDPKSQFDYRFNVIRSNYDLILQNLDGIGYKNSYTQLSKIYAYVHQNLDATNTPIKNSRGTYAREKDGSIDNKIRLSSGYRRSPVVPKKGKHSRPGTIIHEASHLILGTKDIQFEDKIFTLKYEDAIKNADTYRCAAENF